MPESLPTNWVSPLSFLSPYDSKTRALNVVTETIRGSRNKLKFEQKRSVFALKSVLPPGSVFPYDFGSVPGTLGEDGDTVDVMILMEAPAFPGCVVACRLLGMIEATQTEKNGKKMRNDRLIAVARAADRYAHMRQLVQLGRPLVEEIEHFFVRYNQAAGKVFKPLVRRGVRIAQKAIGRGIERFKNESKRLGRLTHHRRAKRSMWLHAPCQLASEAPENRRNKSQIRPNSSLFYVQGR